VARGVLAKSASLTLAGNVIRAVEIAVICLGRIHEIDWQFRLGLSGNVSQRGFDGSCQARRTPFET